MLETVNTEEIGTLKILQQTKASQSVAEGKGLHEGTVGGESMLKSFQYRPVLSFGKSGSSDGMLQGPWGLAVNDRDEIAVIDSLNHRVQIFNSSGDYLRGFGQQDDMDIKTLLYNLREEVSCSVCSDIFTDPKHLPCLHSFCLHCLKQWHRTSHGRDTIRCPNCQAVSRVPESGDLKDLPTSFYLNGLIDVLAIKECKSSQVRCGNCDKKSSETSYCFQCCIFYCQKCGPAHDIIKSNNGHRVLALKDFQDKDYEDVLKRPVFCAKQRHEKKELEYFCKNCETAVCQTCVLMDHPGHALEYIEEEAERQKIEMTSMIETHRHILQAKLSAVSQLDEDFAKQIQQGEDLKQDVQRIVDNLITTLEAQKQNIFAAVETETQKSLESLTAQKTKIEHQIEVVKSSLEKADKVLTRSAHAEVVQLKKSLETILKGVDQTEPTDRDPKCLPKLVFVENQKMFETVNTKEIGTLEILQQTKASQSVAEGKGLEEGTVGRETQFVLTTRNSEGRQCYNKHDRVTVEIRDEQGRECAMEVQINDNKDGRYKISYSLRDQGRYKVTVKCDRHLIVSDRDEHCVKVFNRNGNFQYKFGKQGGGDGEFNGPLCLSVNKSGHLMVCDSRNDRVQVFELNGKFVGKFGTNGSKLGEFNSPYSVSVLSNGRIVVCEYSNHRVQMLE
ncbi:hypothetical protein ACROYT_G034991 [Oculina patagonica]